MTENGENQMAGQQQPADPHAHTKRDAETQMVLGAFVSFIAVPVVVGTYWANSTAALIVNLLAGVVLFGIGVVMGVLGWVKHEQLKQQ